DSAACLVCVSVSFAMVLCDVAVGCVVSVGGGFFSQIGCYADEFAVGSSVGVLELLSEELSDLFETCNHVFSLSYTKKVGWGVFFLPHFGKVGSIGRSRVAVVGIGRSGNFSLILCSAMVLASPIIFVASAPDASISKPCPVASPTSMTMPLSDSDISPSS